MHQYYADTEHGYVERKSRKSLFLLLIPILAILALAVVAAIVLGLIPVYLSGKSIIYQNLIKNSIINFIQK